MVDIVDIVNSGYGSRYSGCARVRRGCFIFTRLIVKKDDASAALPCVQPASVRCGAGLGSHGHQANIHILVLSSETVDL